jgi:opacity protein-like surface antigen
MKKVTLCIAVCIALLMSMAVSAQNTRIGVIGGVNLANISTDEEGAEPKSLTAFGVGGVLDFAMGENMSLCFEPMYLQKGSKEDVTEEGFTTEVKVKSTYIEVPVFLKLYLGSGDTRPYVMAGPTFGFLMSSNMEMSTMGIGVEVDIKEIMESIDYGVGFGGGISLPMGRNTLFAEARYTLGLADIFKGGEVEIMEGAAEEIPDAEIKTKGIQIMAGIMIPLGE